MAFGLPSKGQQDWDDEVSNSIQSIKDTADDAHSKAVVAENTATQAATTATEAKSAAEAALSQVSSSTGTLGSAVSAAETAKAAAEAAQAAAEAVGTTNDEVIAGQITDDASQTSAALKATIATAVGGAPAFPAVADITPADLANKVAWFKADALAGANGSSVATWADSYGQHNLTQATGTKQPTLQTVKGGKVVRFAGAQWLSTATFTSAPQPLTIAALIRFTAIPTAAQMVLGTNQNGMLFANSEGSWSLQAAGTPKPLPLPVGTFFQSVVAVYNGATSTLRVNGVQVDLSSSPGTNGITQMFIGANAFGSGNLSGDLAELFIVGHVPDQAELLAVEKYLRTRKAVLAA